MAKLEINETEYYTEMLKTVTFEKLCDYLKKNQGILIDDISENFNKDLKNVEYLVNIWIDHWNTFYESGRVVKNGKKYFFLSPRNKKSRERNPIIEYL